MEQNYLAQVQALIDQKWKENPEEMKRVMAEIEAKEKAEIKSEIESPKRVSFDPQLTQELIEELNKPLGEFSIRKIHDLVQRGADVNVKNKNGETPFHLAMLQYDESITNHLFKAGANLEERTNRGWTPLHYASHWENEIMIDFLMSKGANLEAITDEGYSVFDLVDTNETMKLLKEYKNNLEK